MLLACVQHTRGPINYLKVYPGAVLAIRYTAYTCCFWRFCGLHWLLFQFVCQRDISGHLISSTANNINLSPHKNLQRNGLKFKFPQNVSILRLDDAILVGSGFRSSLLKSAMMKQGSEEFFSKICCQVLCFCKSWQNHKSKPAKIRLTYGACSKRGKLPENPVIFTLPFERVAY